MGKFLFRHRTWITVPLALTLIFCRWEARPFRSVFGIGALLVITGEGFRLWAVRHIGVISRTRADRLGSLVTTGPYYVVRNPLYIGNVMLWSGFVCLAALPWMLPVVWAILGLQYVSISRWEHDRLLDGFGQQFLDYAIEVPGWVPAIGRARAAWGQPAAFSWAHVLFSERGTLISVVLMGLVLWLKQKLM